MREAARSWIAAFPVHCGFALCAFLVVAERILGIVGMPDVAMVVLLAVVAAKGVGHLSAVWREEAFDTGEG